MEASNFPAVWLEPPIDEMQSHLRKSFQFGIVSALVKQRQHSIVHLRNEGFVQPIE